MWLSVDEAGVVVTNPIMGHYGSGHILRKADQAARYGIRQEIFMRRPWLCCKAPQPTQLGQFGTGKSTPSSIQSQHLHLLSTSQLPHEGHLRKALQQEEHCCIIIDSLLAMPYSNQMDSPPLLSSFSIL